MNFRGSEGAPIKTDFVYVAIEIIGGRSTADSKRLGRGDNRPAHRQAPIQVAIDIEAKEIAVISHGDVIPRVELDRVRAVEIRESARHPDMGPSDQLIL